MGGSYGRRRSSGPALAPLTSQLAAASAEVSARASVVVPTDLAVISSPFLFISNLCFLSKLLTNSRVAFLTVKTETGSFGPNHVRILKLLLPLAATTLSARNFLSGALAFQGLNLGLKFLVLFRQRIAASCHRFEIVSHLTVLLLKFRHLGLQFLVLLQGFCVLAGS